MPKADRKRRSQGAGGQPKTFENALGQRNPLPIKRTPGSDTVGEFETEKKSSKTKDLAKESNRAEPIDSMSRGQRKRQAKREKYLRKEKMILSSLLVKRAEEQAKRIDGLDAMKAALLESVGQSTDTAATTRSLHEGSVSMLKSNRGRKHLVQQETEQMKLVLQHPSFRADPLDTIREHLQNSIQPKPPTENSSTKPQIEKVKRRRKKKSYRATRTKNR